MSSNDKIEVQNINIPGRTNRVNAEKYLAMKEVLLRVLPDTSPGLTQKEIMKKLVTLLPEDLYPGGATSGWWMKTVQLDLEAKEMVTREQSKPLRWYKQ